METAKLMLTYSLPIKCMESVIMAIYLTNQVNRLIRFPISFKSCHNGIFYYHIVLGLVFDGKYGSVGLSRKANLMGYRGLITLLSRGTKCSLATRITTSRRREPISFVVFYGIFVSFLFLNAVQNALWSTPRKQRATYIRFMSLAI